MIDLALKRLPDTIEADGGRLRVDTSFRSWLLWGRILEEQRFASPHVLLDPPAPGWARGAAEFYRCPVATPKPSKGERVLDLLLDGDYIVGSFQQAYGLDLTEGDMHWHRFLALLRSLPQDTKAGRIMGYRSYDGRKRRQDEAMKRLKQDWALPKAGDAEIIAWQREVFG